MVLAHFWLGFALCTNCDFEKGYHHLKNALDFNVAANSLWGISQVKSTLAFVYNLKGDVNPGYQISDEAVQLAEESGDILSKGLAYTGRGMSCYAKGYFEDAVKNLLIGNDFCEKVAQFTWVALAQLWWGMSCFDIGEYEDSMDHHLKAAWTVKHNKLFPAFMNICLFR